MPITTATVAGGEINAGKVIDYYKVKWPDLNRVTFKLGGETQYEVLLGTNRPLLECDEVEVETDSSTIGSSGLEYVSNNSQDIIFDKYSPALVGLIRYLATELSTTEEDIYTAISANLPVSA